MYYLTKNCRIIEIPNFDSIEYNKKLKYVIITTYDKAIDLEKFEDVELANIFIKNFFKRLSYQKEYITYDEVKPKEE